LVSKPRFLVQNQYFRRTKRNLTPGLRKRYGFNEEEKDHYRGGRRRSSGSSNNYQRIRKPQRRS
jgi:ribosomal protein L3